MKQYTETLASYQEAERHFDGISARAAATISRRDQLTQQLAQLEADRRGILAMEARLGKSAELSDRRNANQAGIDGAKAELEDLAESADVFDGVILEAARDVSTRWHALDDVIRELATAEYVAEMKALKAEIEPRIKRIKALASPAKGMSMSTDAIFAALELCHVEAGPAKYVRALLRHDVKRVVDEAARKAQKLASPDTSWKAENMAGNSNFLRGVELLGKETEENNRRRVAAGIR